MGLLTGLLLVGFAVTTYWLAYSKRRIFDPILKIPGAGSAIALAAITALTYGAVVVLISVLAKLT